MSDYISRQKAIDALKIAYLDNDIQSAKDDPCIVDAMTDWAIRQVKALPSADAVEVRHGTWIEDRYNNLDYVCSECGEPCADMVMGKPRDKYCKWCGARMDGD